MPLKCKLDHITSQTKTLRGFLVQLEKIRLLTTGYKARYELT